MGLDRGGRSDSRQRRAFQQLDIDPLGSLGLIAGAGIAFTNKTLSVDLRDTTPGLELAASGLGVIIGDGLELTATGVEIDLAANPGLAFSGGDLIVDLRDTDPGLELVASGVGVLLGSDPGLTITNGLTIDLRDTTPCLELDSTGLGLTLEENVGIFALGSTGLDSQYITTAGVANDVDLTLTCDSNTDNFVSLIHPSGGEITIDGDGIAFGYSPPLSAVTLTSSTLIFTGGNSLIFRVGATTVIGVDSTSTEIHSVGPLVDINMSVPGPVASGTMGNVNIHTGDGGNAFGAATLGIVTLRGGNATIGSNTEGGSVAITGGQSRGNPGGSVTITGGIVSSGSGVGGAVTLLGGTGRGTNQAGGAVTLTGGQPTGTGASTAGIQVTDNAGSVSTLFAADLTGLGFYGTTTAAQQTSVEATPDSIRAALVAYNLITAASDSKTTPRWQKYGISESDFTGGTGTEQITLFSLGAAEIIHAVKIKHSITWSAFGVSAVTLSVGIAATPTKYHGTFNVLQAPGDTVQSVEANIGIEDHASGTNIVVELIVTGGTAGGLTTGAAEIWVLVSTADGNTP